MTSQTRFHYLILANLSCKNNTAWGYWLCWEMRQISVSAAWNILFRTWPIFCLLLLLQQCNSTITSGELDTNNKGCVRAAAVNLQWTLFFLVYHSTHAWVCTDCQNTGRTPCMCLQGPRHAKWLRLGRTNMFWSTYPYSPSQPNLRHTYI